MLTKPSRPVRTFADTWLRAGAGQRFLLDVQTAQHLEQEQLKPSQPKVEVQALGVVSQVSQERSRRSVRVPGPDVRLSTTWLLLRVSGAASQCHATVAPQHDGASSPRHQ